MKLSRLVIYLIMVLFANTAWSDTVIQMEEYGGVYRIPCTVNGAKMKFIFDTGASSVSMSIGMAEYLMDNDYISDKDFIGVGQTQTADGSIVDHLRINLKEIEIGGLKLRDIEAIVIASQNAPLLLGQSAIQKLGHIQLNGSQLIISGGSNQLKDDEIDYYGTLADKALGDGNYIDAEKYYSILYESDALSEYGISEYARACDANGNHKEAINLYRQLLSSELSNATSYNPVTAQFNLFVNLAHAYVGNNQCDWGNVYIEKGLELANDCNYSGTKLNANKIKGAIAQNYAATLWNKDLYTEAADYYFKALEFYAAEYNLNATSCWNKCISKNAPVGIKGNESIMNIASNYAECQWLGYRFSDEEFTTFITALAQNGSRKARIFCNKNNIRY